MLILCNAIGSPVDSKYVKTQPLHVAMNSVSSFLLLLLACLRLENMCEPGIDVQICACAFRVEYRRGGAGNVEYFISLGKLTKTWSRFLSDHHFRLMCL